MPDPASDAAADTNTNERMETRFARRGSATVTYEAVGAADGPAVVLLHDLLSDRSSLAPLRNALVAAGFRAIVPDLRGHGASAALSTKPYPMAELGADLLAVLDAEVVDRAHLIGHGLGGAIALAVGCAAPTRVASVTLLAPSVVGVLDGADDPLLRLAATEEREVAEAAAKLATIGQTERALDAWFDPRSGAGWRGRLPRQRLAAIRRQAGALGPMLAAWETHSPLPDALSRCGVPTFVVATEGESPVDAGIRRILVATLPNARDVAVAGTASVADALADPVRWSGALVSAWRET